MISYCFGFLSSLSSMPSLSSSGSVISGIPSLSVSRWIVTFTTSSCGSLPSSVTLIGTSTTLLSSLLHSSGVNVGTSVILPCSSILTPPTLSFPSVLFNSTLIVSFLPSSGLVNTDSGFFAKSWLSFTVTASLVWITTTSVPLYTIVFDLGIASV